MLRVINETKEDNFTIRKFGNKYNFKNRNKLVLSNSDGYYVVDILQIVYLIASENYTFIKTSEGKTHTVSKTLKHFENLAELGFIRCHQSYMINLDHLVSTNRNLDQIIMSDGSKISVSRSKKADLKNLLNSGLVS